MRQQRRRNRPTTAEAAVHPTLPTLNHEETKVHDKGIASFVRFRRRSWRMLLVFGGFFIAIFVRTARWAIRARREKATRYHPRYVYFVVGETDFDSHRKVDLNMILYPTKRVVFIPNTVQRRREGILDSREYKYGRADVFETKECKAQYPWQLTSFPTCSTLHEFDLTDLQATSRHRQRVTLIAHGYWRDVWVVRESLTGTERVLKTLRYEHNYEDRNYDRHRRDAVAMERLTKSPLVVDIYAFCGNSGIFEFANGGDITDAIWPRKHHKDEPAELTPITKLHIGEFQTKMLLLVSLHLLTDGGCSATQAAMGLAAVHNIDKEGQASIAHTDITPGQFVLVDGVYKLNDFNRARFIRWSRTGNEPCGYYVGRNPGKVSWCRSV